MHLRLLEQVCVCVSACGFNRYTIGSQDQHPYHRLSTLKPYTYPGLSNLKPYTLLVKPYTSCRRPRTSRSTILLKRHTANKTPPPPPPPPHQVPTAKNLKIIMTITSLHDGERAVPPEQLEKAGLTYEGFSMTPTTWDPSGEVCVCVLCACLCVKCTSQLHTRPPKTHTTAPYSSD